MSTVRVLVAEGSEERIDEFGERFNAARMAMVADENNLVIVDAVDCKTFERRLVLVIDSEEGEEQGMLPVAELLMEPGIDYAERYTFARQLGETVH